MAGTKLRKLRDEAQECVNKGKYAKALDRYRALEAADPDDASWSRRAGDMCRRLDDRAGAAAAFTRAVDKYVKAGFLVKAIATCKLILQIDPDHRAALERLSALNGQRGFGSQPVAPVPAAAPAASSTGPAAPSRPGDDGAGARVPADDAIPIDDAIVLEDAEVDVLELLDDDAPPTARPMLPGSIAPGTIPPGAPLDAVTLGQLVPGSRRFAPTSGELDVDVESGCIEIPLDLTDELELALDDGDIELELELADTDVISLSAETASALRATPLFARLSPTSLERLIHRVELATLAPGDVLFREGEAGTALYVVAEGEVAVVSEGPPRVTLAKLGEGSFFGEVALVTEQPRSATVEALAPTELLVIERAIVAELVEEEPEMLRVLLRFLRDRLFDRLLHTSPLFSQFGPEERRSLGGKFRFLEVDSGALLIEQGGRADGLFVVLSGNLEVVRTTEGVLERLATLGPGDLCGEMSLLASDPAVATVRATHKCLVLELPASEFREIIMTHPQVLMYVGELADERRRRFDAVIDGDADYQEGRLELF